MTNETKDQTTEQPAENTAKDVDLISPEQAREMASNVFDAAALRMDEEMKKHGLQMGALVIVTTIYTNNEPENHSRHTTVLATVEERAAVQQMIEGLAGVAKNGHGHLRGLDAS